MRIFDQEAFKDPNWEYVLGAEGSASNYQADGSKGTPMSQMSDGTLARYTPRANVA